MNQVEAVYGLRPREPGTNRPAGGRRSSRRRMRSPQQKSSSSPAPETSLSPPSQRRRSARGSSSLWDLAKCIQEGKNVVFITGAGLSVASGVRAFRTTNDSSSLYSSHGGVKMINGKRGLVEEQPLGIWNSTLWTQAKRETFRKDPLQWWNNFWLRFFPVEDYENKYQPNAGHKTIALLQQAFPDSIKIITQNVDGLQHVALDQNNALNHDEETVEKLKRNIIEAHGKLGLYKCIPAEDSDTDSSSDEDDDRAVHLGHRRKYRAWKQRYHTQPASSWDGEKDLQSETPCAAVSTDVSSGSSSSATSSCRYQMLESLTVDQLKPTDVHSVLSWDSSNIKALSSGRRLLTAAPCCPGCGNFVLPQALLFDEGYHSHEHYNFTKMEDWLASADALVFVGTSFAVTLPLCALDHARDVNLPVYNFNVSDMLESTARLNAENIMGPSQETLPKLWKAIQCLQEMGNVQTKT